jgi:hypothetical protein
MKLDWFAGRGIEAIAPACAVAGLRVDGKPVSDHDPIVCEIRQAKTQIARVR